MRMRVKNGVHDANAHQEFAWLDACVYVQHFLLAYILGRLVCSVGEYGNLEVSGHLAAADPKVFAKKWVVKQVYIQNICAHFEPM